MIPEKNRNTAAAGTDILIVGGGVIGLFCAYYLNRAGRTVRLIERDKIGAGASRGNCGLLFFSDPVPLCAPGVPWQELRRFLTGTSPLHIQPTLDLSRLAWFLKFATKCHRAHLQHATVAKAAMLRYADLLYTAFFGDEASALECEYERRGILIVHRSEADMAAYGKLNRLLIPFGLQAEAHLGRDLQRLEPALGENLYGGWLHPMDRHLRPEGLLVYLKRHLAAAGVLLEEQCALTKIRNQGGRVVGLETDQGLFTAGTYLLATGAWTSAMQDEIGAPIPIQPGKGYSVTMARPSLPPKIPCYLHERNTVVTPWRSGYRLGGTMEFSGHNLDLNRRRLDRLKIAAGEYMRSPLGDPVVEEWAGLRPMTPDDMPIVGRVPRLENLYLATGHGMLGLTLGPATGMLMTQLITKVPSDLDPKPYGLERFLR